LVVVLGLVVSLARYVRRNASLSAVRQQLITLNAKLNETGIPPELPMFAPGLNADDERRLPEAMRTVALQNAELWSKYLGIENKGYLDPWGMPIVVINGAHPALGMAPRFRPFFLSAGSDCRYFTLADDIYGYDIDPVSMVGPKGSQSPATQGGHRE
jgi:hypothetical protein